MKEIKPEDIKEMSESELHKTLYEYFKPVLEDCSQGARLKYIREYRQLSTKEVAELCPHLTGENKIRSIQKYERNDRSPKPYILEDLAKVYDVNINAIRKYDKPSFWTSKASDEVLMKWCKENVDFSKYLESECKKYNIKFFDISHNREEVFNSIKEYILEEEKSRK